MKHSTLALAALLGACSSSGHSTALTPRSLGPAFADYAVEKADTNRDGKISLAEWKAVGGSEDGFAAIDRSRDGVLTVGEIQTAGSTDKFFAFAKRTIDTGGNTDLTPIRFRSPAGAKLFSYEF